MEKYKLLLAAVTDILKAEGFKKTGNTFYVSASNNWGLLNFQKSKSSSIEIVLFTINIGICSAALRRIIDQADVNKKPDIGECHWHARIGSLMPQKPDFWWKVDETVSLEQIANDVIATIKTLALPAIENHISDEHLESEWTNGTYMGTTEMQHFIYLTTLLKLYQKDNLPLVIEELKVFSKGKPYEYAANEHIKELETYA